MLHNNTNVCTKTKSLIHCSKILSCSTFLKVCFIFFLNWYQSIFFTFSVVIEFPITFFFPVKQHLNFQSDVQPLQLLSKIAKSNLPLMTWVIFKIIATKPLQLCLFITDKNRRWYKTWWVFENGTVWWVFENGTVWIGLRWYKGIWDKKKNMVVSV